MHWHPFPRSENEDPEKSGPGNAPPRAPAGKGIRTAVVATGGFCTKQNTRLACLEPW